MPAISFDHRAITIDAKRQLILSGAIHYPRSTPAMWPGLMKESKAAGLNTIETYVFWNLHERQQGVYDFSERLNLRLFCELAQQFGLNVILRIGPYICAETNFGGFPAWLRDVPGIQFRTDNEPFKREMSRWVRLLVENLRGLFAPEGGPIILAQIENEYNNIAASYGEAGKRYLDWSIELSESLNLGVPWVMCEGSAGNAVATINTFYGHTRLEKFFAEHPNQPALWTENWPAWYDCFGYGHHVRSAEDVAYGVARFFAQGGTGVNYYMWHGGTNFDRETMFLQTTSYDFNAPLDEFGLPTTKSNHLGKLHRTLQAHADALLTDTRPESQSLGEKQAAYTHGQGTKAVTFLCNDDKVEATVEFAGTKRKLAPMSVVMLAGGKVLLDTARVAKSSAADRKMKPLPASTLDGWRWLEEPMPAQRLEDEQPVVAPKPVEQLLLTADASDYCWYMTQIDIAKSAAGQSELLLDGVADVVYVYVDGKLAARTQGPLAEDRGAFNSEHWKQKFTLDLKPGVHELAILCTAIGLIKGDWQIGRQNMVLERKGLFGQAKLNGKKIAGPWAMLPWLRGELLGVDGLAGELATWRKPTTAATRQPLRWWRCDFTRPRGDAPLALDLADMTKGMVFVNGRCIGRHWLIDASEKPIHGWHPASIVKIGQGQPTQRYYHLPPDWLDEVNSLVIFEEEAGDPREIRLCQRI